MKHFSLFPTQCLLYNRKLSHSLGCLYCVNCKKTRLTYLSEAGIRPLSWTSQVSDPKSPCMLSSASGRGPVLSPQQSAREVPAL